MFCSVVCVCVCVFFLLIWMPTSTRVFMSIYCVLWFSMLKMSIRLLPCIVMENITQVDDNDVCNFHCTAMIFFLKLIDMYLFSRWYSSNMLLLLIVLFSHDQRVCEKCAFNLLQLNICIGCNRNVSTAFILQSHYSTCRNYHVKCNVFIEYWWFYPRWKGLLWDRYRFK